MLYIRMFISVIISLYTSRVVLQTLGVEDYGIYGVVGGIVAMMGFINASMSGATSRFLTFELGRGDFSRLSKTFSSALLVHIIIAVIVLVLAETVGLWFLCNKLVIPEGRMTAAHWVYQLSILSAMLTITQVPYNSSIIAHEKMDIYAYVEILNVSLKLLIVYLLQIGDFDKLILYAILMFAVSLIIIMVYRIYCLQKFKECKFHWIWEKEYMKPLLTFSGWNLFGNLGGVMSIQGTNFIINSLFGVVMNAASGVAFTASGVISQFAYNAMTAFRPPIIKLYAKGDVIKMQDLTLLAIKVIMLLYTLIAIPFFVECDNLLCLWLVEVPTMTSVFCRIILLSIFFETIRYIIIINVHASGNVKLVSAFSGTLFCLSPVLIYLTYRNDVPVQSAFVILTLTNAILTIINIFILKHYTPKVEAKKYFKTILKIVFSTFIVLVITSYVTSFFKESILRLLFTSSFSLILQTFVFYFFSLTMSQRYVVLCFIKTKLHL